MSIRVSASNLAQATKDLTIEWQHTKAAWRDIKCAEFEHKYLEDLPNLIASANPIMEEIDALIRKVINDCE